MKTPLYLLKDIVIPAGTLFHPAPAKTERVGDGHISQIIGLSKDTSGDFAYYVGPDGSEEREQLKEWFSDEPPLGGCPPDCYTKPDPDGISTHNMAAQLYTAYCEAVGGTAFGEPLPDWTEFSNDPHMSKQLDAWLAVAEIAIAPTK